ncbi:hypothetical protein [Streptomyces hoynatensis]|uniref:Integral membrane protein n=1 Tax=Streptomyces hoynatensis TaxID=1141874 RepID=A0A3A9YWU0_9ACTN|nr:hypothetical protein [Streptomyces hoynatensis]RKN40478.1 hypothetical protein D7294_18745 [Streptomyces hoynatensis]
MSESSTTSPGPEVAGRPRRVSAAALICAAQGAVIAVLGASMLVLAVVGDPDSVSQAVTGALTVLALAALPLAAGHGLWRLRRWSRGPAVIVQLISLPVAWTLFGSGALWPLAGAALALSALAVLGCLINPTATEALGVGPREA